MKKIIAILVILSMFFAVFSVAKASNNKSEYFIVTAYYSPLPNQEYYMMGNFEAEKILQGNGTHGASGKQVFSGMFAAPKKYSFGTKIYLEGIGVGEVTDRGGAIVQAGKRGHKHDRIDIWMGYGDEGLKRALAWGKRTVKGRIVSSHSKTTFNYKNRAAPDWAVRGLKVKKEKTIFDYNIGKKSDKEKIKKLQKFFREVGIYRGEIDGIYNREVMDIVFDLQIASGIVKSENDYGAGYFGPKTRAAFKKMYLNSDLKKSNLKSSYCHSELDSESLKCKNTNYDSVGPKEMLLSATSREGKQSGKKEEKAILDLEKLKNNDIFTNNFGKTEDEIKEILKIMKELKIYNGEVNTNYKKFISVVYDFQVKNSIVKSELEAGAGYFGPKTRKKLKEVYSKYIDEKIQLEKEKQAEEKRKQELKEKYKKIELYAKNKAENKTKSIGFLKEGEVSVEVRNLQNTLKELGYFDYNDTAIFGKITKKAVADFQIEYNLVDSYNNKYAGIMGERTLTKLKEVLYKKYYDEKINSEKLVVSL